MKEYPVGSVCVILSSDPYWDNKECTIVGRLAIRTGSMGGENVVGEMYDVDVKGHSGEAIHTYHRSLKLRKLPPSDDAWCRDVMKKVLEPVEFFFEVKETE